MPQEIPDAQLIQIALTQGAGFNTYAGLYPAVVRDLLRARGLEALPCKVCKSNLLETFNGRHRCTGTEGL